MEKKLHLLQVAGSAVGTANLVRSIEREGWQVTAEPFDRSNFSANPEAEVAYDLAVVYCDRIFTPQDVLTFLRDHAHRFPCAVAMEEIDQEVSAFLEAGAIECFPVTEPSRLLRAIRDFPRVAPAQPAAGVKLKSADAAKGEMFAQAFLACPDAITISRMSDAVYLEANDTFVRLLGYTREEVIGKSAKGKGLSIWLNQCDRQRLIDEVTQSGFVEGMEAPFRTKSGKIITGLLSARGIEYDGEKCLLCFVRDISERKRAENIQEATLRLLHICNQPYDIKELAREVTRFFKNLSECEAVGLRVREGPDFPYYKTEGFSEEFVLAENQLCTYGKGGELVRDENGRPVHACMCGHLLHGVFDPSRPYFTKRGSFWTNSTSELAATMRPEDRVKGTRNRCVNEGYESIALIPLRNRSEYVGLLQINDHGKGRFSAEKIELLESLAEYVTVALEKLRADQALRTNEEHLRLMLANTEAGYFFVDPQGRYQKVNAAWLRLHGFESPGEIIGRHYSSTCVESDPVSTQLIYQKLLAGETIAPIELARKRKDGAVGYQTLSAHVVKEHDHVVGIEGFIIDSTSLRTVREQYQMLFEQMLDGFTLHEMVYDAKGKVVDFRILAANPAFEAVVGQMAKDLVGRLSEAIQPGLRERWIETFGEVDKSGIARRIDGFSKSLNKYVEVVAFRPRKGQVACVVRDVTAKKQLELQLLHSQKMEAIGQLAGGVAHDFNNFLAAIMMHLNLLQRTPGMGNEVVNSLKELETEARHAASLTRQLLMFSYRQVVQLVPTDINELLGHLLKMLRRLIGEHIKITYEGDGTPLWINADPGMIDQVIMNLCVNARDAMPQGGSLVIKAEALAIESTETLGDVENRTGRYLSISVTDNGCGMSAETQRHIFEPFFTTKEPGKGTGIGLATVYSIVKQHHGWIDVKSQLGKGSAFRVFFPLVQPPAQNDKTPNSEAESIKGGVEGVLVVEDDYAFRNMVVMSLRVMGYKVFEAANGKTALDLWVKNNSDIGLLLTDQVMPDGISGLELCRRLRSERPNLRMIITTGYVNDRIKPASLEQEGITLLPKPFTAETLANTVRQCIDSASPSPV